MPTRDDGATAPGCSTDRVATPVRSLSVFFPCYDDEASIASMVRGAADVVDQFGLDGEIIVVDDGSSDGSGRVLDELSLAEPRLRVVTHPTNRGYGGALLSGFAAASREWVFYTDGDGQYDPADLARLLVAASDDVDVVQGYKTSRSDNVARRIIGRLYHRAVSVLFGLRVRDTDCDFRLIRREALNRIHLEKSSGVICVELIRKLQVSGARFIEVGVGHYPRLHGRSRFFKVGNLLRTLRDLLFLFRELVVAPRWAIHKRWCFGVLAIPSVWTVTFLTALRRPVGRADEAWFLWVAARANSGTPLYRGVYYVSTPLAIWCMQVMDRIFGTQVAVERALAASCFTGSLVLVWIIAGRVHIGSRGRALLVATVFLYGSPLAHFGSVYSLLAVTCALGAVLATLHAVREGGRGISRRAAAVAGLCAGAAFTTKPNVGILVLAATSVAVTLGSRRAMGSWRDSVRSVAATAAGFAAPVVAMLVPLVVSGSVGSMVGDVFLGKGSAYFAIEGRRFAPGFWDAFSFLTGSQSPLGQLIVRTGRLVPLLAVVLTVLTVRRVGRQLSSAGGVLLVFGLVGFGAAAPDFGPQHITEVMPLLLVLPVLAYAQLPRSAPRAARVPARMRTAVVLASGLALTVGIVSVVSWSNRPYLRGNDQAVASTIPHFDGTLVSAVNEGHVRSDLQQLHSLTGGHVFISRLPASFYYLAAHLQNPTPYDYPAPSDLGAGGEHAVISAIRDRHVKWACIRPASERTSSPVDPLRIELYVRRRFVFAKHLNLCDLYHSRASATRPVLGPAAPGTTGPTSMTDLT